MCVNTSEAMIYEETTPYSHFTPCITKPSAFKTSDTVDPLLLSSLYTTYRGVALHDLQMLGRCSAGRCSPSAQAFLQHLMEVLPSRDVSFHWLICTYLHHTHGRPQASVSPQLIKLRCYSCGTTSLPFITNAWGRKPLAFGSLLLLQFLLSVCYRDKNHCCFVGLETGKKSLQVFAAAELVAELLMLLGEVLLCAVSHSWQCVMSVTSLKWAHICMWKSVQVDWTS